MDLRELSAEVISRPGALGDSSYPALEIRVKGFVSPYVLTLALPAVAYRALADQFDPIAFYDAIASELNRAGAAPDSTIAASRSERVIHAQETPTES